MRMTFWRACPPLLVSFAVLVSPAASGRGFVEKAPTCVEPDSVVGFFNGVWNGESDAGHSLAKLEEELESAGPVSRSVRYELFYNQTGTLVGASALQDLAEVFIQRADDFDGSGVLSQRWELLWDAIRRPRNSWLERVITVAPTARGFFEALFGWIDTRIAAELAQAFSAAPTEADYRVHGTRLRALGIEGKKLLLVGHSQGNLFVNRAYDLVSSEFGHAGVSTIHIAPASPTVRGPYWLANIDAVINSLRAHGSRWFASGAGIQSITVLPNNIVLPRSGVDHSGHKLVETYLDPQRPARDLIIGAARSALQALVAPITSGAHGLFSVTLTWDRAGDLDLHTIEPDGAHVYYEALVSPSGFLDYDNIVGYGPEHYYARCHGAREGVYRFGVNHYQGATGALATVQVASERDGELATRVLHIGEERGPAGNSQPALVVTVTVGRDSAGGLSVSAR